MPNSKLILRQMEIGPLQNFIYFVGDKATGHVAIVDPAWDVDFLIKEARKNNYTITKVFLTHGHPDHVNGLEELLSKYDVPVFISKHEASFFMPKCRNLKKLEDGEIIRIGAVDFKVLHTPGHSPGCQCFLFDKTLIAGGTVFIDGCGRCDLPGSDPKQMYNSLYNVIKKLPDDIVIYPGHNYGPVPFATVKEQKESNPYLQSENINEFLQHRMGLVL